MDKKLMNKVITVLITGTMIITSIILPIKASTEISALDLGDDVITNAYTWDASSATLVISEDTVIKSTGTYGIYFDSAAIIELNADLTIEASDYAIYCKEDLKISGLGSLTIITDGTGIYGEKNVDIRCTNIAIESIGTKGSGPLVGISSDAALTMNVLGDLHIVMMKSPFACIYGDTVDIEVNGNTYLRSKGYGISAMETIQSTFCGEAYVTATNVAFDTTNGSITSEFFKHTTISSSGNGGYGYYTDYGNVTITVHDFMSLIATSGIKSYDGIILQGNGTVEIYSGGYSLHNQIQAIEIKDSLTLTTNKYTANGGAFIVSKDAVVSTIVLSEDGGAKSTVYGDFCVEYDITIYGELLFHEDASLSVAKDAVFDLSEATIDLSSLVITNNGEVILKDVDISELQFDGIGLVALLDQNDNKHYYDNQGNVAFREDITLSQTEVDNEYYSWVKDETGVYHFTLKRDAIFGSVFINVENANIDLDKDVYIEELYLGTDVFMENEQCHYTITGAYQLNTQRMEVNNTNTTLVIEKDTSVDARLVNMEIIGREEGLHIDVFGSIASIEINTHTLVVHNGGNVYVSGRGIFFYGTDQKDPAFELGDEVKLITPASGGFVTMEIELNTGPRMVSDTYTVGTITIDGKVLDEDETNVANEIIIGRKDIYDITVTKQGEGVIEGDTAVYEGLDQEFIFTPATGYEISDVLVDGNSLGAITSYTFEEVFATHTLEVIFTKVQEDLNDDFTEDKPSTEEDSNDDFDNESLDDNVLTGDINNISLFTALAIIGALSILMHRKRRKAK